MDQDTFYEAIRQINKRLAELESHHTLYRGPKGEKGDKGDTGTPGRNGADGKDSTVLDINALRDELNQFRKEIHDFRAAACTELRQLYDEHAARFVDVCDKETKSFCALRDKASGKASEDFAKLREALDAHRKETEALCALRDKASEELAKFRKIALVLSGEKL